MFKTNPCTIDIPIIKSPLQENILFKKQKLENKLMGIKG